MRFKKPVLQTKAASKLNLLMNFLEKKKVFLLKKIRWSKGGNYLCKLFVAELRSQTSLFFITKSLNLIAEIND